MTRARLQLLLSSALLAALAPACGGSVATDAPDDAGPDEAAADTAPPLDDTARADTAWSDTARSDTRIEPDTAPPDTGMCTPVADNTPCNEKVTYPCGLPFEPSSPPSQEDCKRLCAPVKYSYAPTYYFCSATAASDGSATVYCSSCAVGRKPGNLLAIADGTPRDDDDPIGVALAEMARVEAASVHAFRRLERALCELDADPTLRARARKAARDEITHARMAARLANKRGARPRRVRLAEGPAPTTLELALENAIAGCVHETLGVAYLEHQRSHARDSELRAHAAALYDDELDHAALSWDLVAFFERHLEPEQRVAVRRATERALGDVVTESRRIDPRVRDALGLPPPEVVARLVGTLQTTLFAA